MTRQSRSFGYRQVFLSLSILISVNGVSYFKNKYLCHCVDNTCPDDGQCSKCASGWFGPACQYENLAKSNTHGFITDENDESCEENTKSLEVDLHGIYTFTWARLVFKTNQDLTDEVFSLSFKNTSQLRVTCSKMQIFRVNAWTRDIFCDIDRTVQIVTVNWQRDKSVCSLYISGGRNVAIKQDAKQSSNFYSYLASKAVDGDEGRNFDSNTCSHTNNDNKPWWTNTLYLKKSVNRYVIANRDDVNSVRLKGFTLKSYLLENQNQPLFEYTDPNEKVQQLYTFTSPMQTIKFVEIFLNHKEYLTLCEVKIFGDSVCDSNKYGRECEKTCNCENKTETCFVATGGCPSGCAAGFHGEACHTTCSKGQWGVDCLQSCNESCYDNVCNSTNGDCLEGCLGFSDPPKCHTACQNSYGHNCSFPCPSNCLNNECNGLTGDCYTCSIGYQGPSCENACNESFYGQDCLRKCSWNCSNSLCNNVDGNCLDCPTGKKGNFCQENCVTGTFGHKCSEDCSDNCGESGACSAENGTCLYNCKPGYQGDTCNQTCDMSSWGPACTNNCSDHCIAVNDTAQSLCHPVTGICTLGCMAGFDDCKIGGTDKSTSPDDETPIVVIVVPAVVAFLLIMLIIAGVIIWRRRNRDSKRHMDHVGVYANEVSTTGITVTKDLHLELTVTEHKTEGAQSTIEAYQNVTFEDTSILVKNLNSFMRAHDPKFFADQFNKIPDPRNVTMEIGLSDENKKKNRYKNICTYDHSRVHLEINTDKHEGSYINASYVESYNDKEKYIASQGPNELILNDFVRMLWEQSIEKVVMLTNVIEEGKAKCEKYWPDEDETLFGEIRVRLTTVDAYSDYTIRQMELVKRGKPSKHVTQFHFTAWPDKGVPSSPWALVDFEQRVASCASTRPTLVHCSAGVGRTGTFIALQNVIKQAEETREVDFFNTVAKLREDRIFMIQTPEQYEFLHRATQVALVCHQTSVKASELASRIRFLESTSLTGRNQMVTEFESICSVIEDLNKRNTATNESDDEDVADGNVYQNKAVLESDTKNRFPSIKPDKIHKVRLMYISENTGSYINAVLIPGLRKQSHQILTQLPMPTTVGEFWYMIVQYNVSLIVAFETSQESTDQTVGQYLPKDKENPIRIGHLKICKIANQENRNWEEQKLSVKTSSKNSPDNDEFHVTHLSCIDSDLPPKSLLSFVQQTRSYNTGVDGSTIFMCKNGAEYSGLACILNKLMDRLDQELSLAVPLIVGAVKSIRPQVIPTLDQYKTVYEVMKLYNEASST